MAHSVLMALIDVAPWWMTPKLKDEIEHLTPLGVSITVKRNRPKHSTEQQNYFHLCLGIFAKAYGCSPDEMKDVVLGEAFGSREVLTPSNHVYRVPNKRSSELTVEEYSTLIDTLQRCAAFNGCVLPDAETVA